MTSANVGHHLEVEQRLAADAADLLHVARAGDAEHHGAEDDRRDQHLDQRDEAVAERLQRNAGLGRHVADRAAGDDREQHPEVEMSGQAFHARCRSGHMMDRFRHGPRDNERVPPSSSRRRNATRLGHAALNWVLEYFRTTGEPPVYPPVSTREIADLVDEALPEEPQRAELVLEQFAALAASAARTAIRACSATCSRPAASPEWSATSWPRRSTRT